MSELAWIGRAGAWLALYALLLLGQSGLEEGLIARFQARRARLSPLPAVGRRRRPAAFLALIAAAAAALASGAAIPLAADVAIGGTTWAFHLLGGWEAAVLLVLAAQWVGQGALALAAGRDDPPSRPALGAVLLDALPMLLVLFSLALSAPAKSLRLTAWIAAQSRLYGLGWAGWAQPLGLLLWLYCAAPPAAEARTRATWAGRALALNQALLTGALWLGGWQGPFVERLPGLGLLYTAIKAGAVVFVWTWLRAALPRPGPDAHARAVWGAMVPLALLNLIATAAIVLVG